MEYVKKIELAHRVFVEGALVPFGLTACVIITAAGYLVVDRSALKPYVSVSFGGGVYTDHDSLPAHTDRGGSYAVVR